LVLEIDKYTGKEYNKTRKNISESPPDLGPPNIPKYPNGTSIDECDSPPKRGVIAITRQTTTR
jgi:hypothetical protein